MILPVELFFACITDSTRLEEDKINIEGMYDAVDKLIIVDGSRGDDRLKNYLHSFDTKNKIYRVEFPWVNNFPLSRTQYLNKAKELSKQNSSNWIVRLDSDEHFSPDVIKDLRKLCGIADRKSKDMIAVRCHGIGLDKEGKVRSTSIDEYHKGLIYKLYPHLIYKPAGYGSNVHETYNHGFNAVELDGKNKNTKYYYEHIKSEGEVWRRAHARNFLIGGGGPNYGEKQPLWRPYQKLVKECLGFEPTDWKQYDKYLVKGNVDQRLKDWFILHMFEGISPKPEKWMSYCINNNFFGDTNANYVGAERILGFNYDGASEVREGYRYYFEWLHPEETPKELKGLSIP